MKSIVVYRSKSGFTKQYAQWIAEELKADIFEAQKVSAEMLKTYDKIVYGGGLYAVGINGLKLITRNLDRLEGKKIAVFATGATPPRKEDIEKVRDMNFTPLQQKQTGFFYLRGGFDYSKLKLIDKILMNMLKLKIKGKKKTTQLEPDEIGMLAAYDKPVDFSRKKNIEELIAYINS
ncbi:MAG: flavodoxin [Eubacterium sp.]|jgi:menaquinone-dependent protoporphyrinogen IX oxidase|nr:flavodoxin [Eubacterium sp.]